MLTTTERHAKENLCARMMSFFIFLPSSLLRVRCSTAATKVCLVCLSNHSFLSNVCYLFQSGVSFLGGKNRDPPLGPAEGVVIAPVEEPIDFVRSRLQHLPPKSVCAAARIPKQRSIATSLMEHSYDLLLIPEK